MVVPLAVAALIVGSFLLHWFSMIIQQMVTANITQRADCCFHVHRGRISWLVGIRPHNLLGLVQSFVANGGASADYYLVSVVPCFGSVLELYSGQPWCQSAKLCGPNCLQAGYKTVCLWVDYYAVIGLPDPRQHWVYLVRYLGLNTSVGGTFRLQVIGSRFGCWHWLFSV